jgi:hypothetical protein
LPTAKLHAVRRRSDDAGERGREGTAGRLTASHARNALASYVGGLTASDQVVEDATLLWVARGVNETGAYTGPIGAGWKAQLVYRFTFLRSGSMASWQALVDAKTGEVVRFVDASAYASLLKASVYTTTNCADPLNCIPGTAVERGVTVPNANLSFAGGVCTGDACYSNSAGAFEYPQGPSPRRPRSTASTSGSWTAAGAWRASGVAPGNIDLGTSLQPAAEHEHRLRVRDAGSPPNSGPAFGGNGDTHSARNAFYHLNLINQKGRVYLPSNEWLKGVDGSAGAAILNVNLPPACNALWQGTTGSLNLTKQTPGLGCNNTGEIPDVFLHEWGTAWTRTTRRAPLRVSTGDGTSPSCRDSTPVWPGILARLDPLGSRAVTAWARRVHGVRDADYTRFCYRGPRRRALRRRIRGTPRTDRGRASRRRPSYRHAHFHDDPGH